MNWAADYYAPNSTVKRNVAVRVEPSGLRFDLDGFVLWPYAEIRMTQGFSPGETVRFVRGPEPAPALVIPDRRVLLETERYAPAFRQVQRHSGLGPTLAFFGAVIVLGIVAVGLLFYYGVPALGESLARFVPISAEERLGSVVAAQLAPPERTCIDSELNSGVQTIMQRLLGAANPHPYRFRVVVTNEESTNALAAPGGHLVIFRGLVRKANTPEELAGVLAHEIQHVLERHSMQGMLRQAGAAALLLYCLATLAEWSGSRAIWHR